MHHLWRSVNTISFFVIPTPPFVGLFVFRSTPGGAQDILLTLCPEFIPGLPQKTYEVSRIETGSATCKTNCTITPALNFHFPGASHNLFDFQNIQVELNVFSNKSVLPSGAN